MIFLQLKIGCERQFGSHAQRHPSPVSGTEALSPRCQPCDSNERSLPWCEPILSLPCARPLAGDSEAAVQREPMLPARPPVGRQQNTADGSAAGAGLREAPEA